MVTVKTTQLIFLIVFTLFSSISVLANIINVPGDYPTIQAGINAAQTGDTVLVQPDTYYENINFNGKNIFVASLYLTTGDTSYITQTIINGNGASSCVKFNNNETTAAVLIGFTLTNGYSYYGAGINCYNGASPTIKNMIITNNHGHAGDSYGGGLCFMSNANAVCSNLVITGNSANEGGGIYFHDNSDVTMSNIVMVNNTSGHGGAMLISYSDPVIDHALMYENSSPFGGAVYVSNYSTPQFTNCTFSKNNADYGGGFYCHDLGGQPTITNCILWGDNSQLNYEIFATSSTYPPIVTYSDIENGTGQSWFGTGCIDTYPLFVDSANCDFHLTEYSPCIDAGDPNSPLDPDGTIADMGVFFFNQASPVIALSTDSLLFQNTPIGESDTLSFTIFNQGLGNLIIQNITNSLSQIFSSNWNPSDSLIVPGDSLILEVIFTPTASVLYTDSLYIENSDSSVYVYLEGNGIISNISNHPSENLLVDFFLYPAYPNPFNPSTTISYNLTGIIIEPKINIYNIKGQEIKSFILEERQGINSVIWNGIDKHGNAVTSGVYLYHLQNNGKIINVRKMILMK